MRTSLVVFALVIVATVGLLEACGSPSASTPDAPPPIDALDKAAACASTFGDVLTNSFGRVDGTIVAVVPPTNTTCAQINSTHLVLQLRVNGAIYRMVTTSWSTSADHRIWFDERAAPLVGGVWAEGWHPGVQLDYATTLHVPSTEFVPYAQADIVTQVSDRLALGAHVSVFATSSGGTKADSAHLIHRNLPDADGAIVIDADGADPHYLLFHFADQTF